MPAINYALGHFMQVISFDKVGFCQHFMLQIAPIPVDMHLINISETGLSNECFGKLIDTG